MDTLCCITKYLELISFENVIIALVLLLLWLYLVLYSEVFVFFFNLPAVYSLFCSSVLDCSPAIHQRHSFHYLVQSVVTEKGFWAGVAHSSSTVSVLLSRDVPSLFVCT